MYSICTRPVALDRKIHGYRRNTVALLFFYMAELSQSSVLHFILNRSNTGLLPYCVLFDPVFACDPQRPPKHSHCNMINSSFRFVCSCPAFGTIQHYRPDNTLIDFVFQAQWYSSVTKVTGTLSISSRLHLNKFECQARETLDRSTVNRVIWTFQSLIEIFGALPNYHRTVIHFEDTPFSSSLYEAQKSRVDLPTVENAFPTPVWCWQQA